MIDEAPQVSRMPVNRDINGNPLEPPPGSSSKSIVKGILAINAIAKIGEGAINYFIGKEINNIDYQYKNHFQSAINNVIDAVNKGVLQDYPQYLNTRDLSDIINVVLTGVNNSGNKEIYDLGMKIYNANNPPESIRPKHRPSGLDVLQNSSHKPLPVPKE